jgi:DNA invertase Pin-like site-specific DNA recombinase
MSPENMHNENKAVIDNSVTAKYAVIYLRVSTKGQVDQYGLDVQLDQTTTYANEHGYTIMETFSELATSGTTEFDDRLAWLAMLDYVTQHDVTAVIIPDLSRLARDLMVQETLLADLRKRGITVISVREPDLCEADPSRKLIRQIIGAINEYDRCMIVARLKLGRVARAKQGERGVGAMPLGYAMQVVDGRHTTVIDEAEADVVRHVFRLRDEHTMPFQQIANWLNDNGHKPKTWTIDKPSKFHNSTVQKIYNRGLYSGVTEYRIDENVSIKGTNDKLRILPQ